MDFHRRMTNPSPSSSPNARQSSIIPTTTTASFFSQQNKDPQSANDLAATNSSMISANLVAQQELQLVDEYVLFHELYHYMSSLYQVMKTTVGASVDVVAATLPAATGERQAVTTRQSQAGSASLTNRRISPSVNRRMEDGLEHQKSAAASPSNEALNTRKSITQHIASIISSRQSSPAPASSNVNRKLMSPEVASVPEEEINSSGDEKDGHNVGKHYYLVLPPDDELRPLIVRCELQAMPTYATSPERVHSRRSKSAGELKPPASAAAADDVDNIPTTTLRIRHNVVRCHLFQGDRHRRHRVKTVENISLTGLSGLSAELSFHLQSSATTESFTADPNNIIGLVSVTPVTAPLPTSSASINTQIEINGFDTIGNLTILYARTPVVKAHATSDGSVESPPLLGGNTSFTAHPTSVPSNGSQMWWQRIPISVNYNLPAECDPKPTECLMAAAVAESEETERLQQQVASGQALEPVDYKTIYNFFPEPQIITLFRQDEQRLTAVLIQELEPRGFLLDEVLTALDTEVGMFNSSYVCMKGFESFIVSKVQSIVELAQESLIGQNTDGRSSLADSTKDIRSKLSPPSAAHMMSTSSRSSNQQHRMITDEEEEQIGATLHIIVTSGIALKINEHWASVNSVDDYAFYHACVSLRKSIQSRLTEFLPDICVGKATIDSFAPTIRICKYIDAPDATLFSSMRAMEGAISSIVTLVTSCCAPGKTHEVTADVCIPLIVLVLILTAPQTLTSRIRLILEFIVPVLELSSLGYALTTFEASAEQIHHEYALMVKSQ